MMIDRENTSGPDFVGFAKAMFEATDWPDGGDVDGFEFQEIAAKYGLLIPEQREALCGENCQCAEYHGAEEMKEGVMCFRRHRALLAEWEQK